MNTKKCLAMILAGGRGKRLGALTHYYSKPAVHFGGNHRIIDFTLSNCNRSRIKTIGVLSQHFSDDLQIYVDKNYTPAPETDDVHMLPPQNGKDIYKGTADAVYKNIDFIERFDPENVLILSGDHIYNMDYNKMLDFHRRKGADITVASTPVAMSEASRFGIIIAGKNGRVCDFEEKPLRPKSCLASMGIYVFKWSVLKKYLLADNMDTLTRHDFGRDILPQMLSAGESIYTYQFDGYWRDVGTVASLWEANMDLLNDPVSYPLPNRKPGESGPYINNTPNFISREAIVSRSIMAGECSIFGKVEHSVLGDLVTVGQNTEIIDSVVMPGVYIGNNTKIVNAVIGTGAIIMDNTVIGADDGTDFFVDNDMCSKGVSLVSPWTCITKDTKLKSGSHIYDERLEEFFFNMNEEIKLGRPVIGDASVIYHIRHKSIYNRSVV